MPERLLRQPQLKLPKPRPKAKAKEISKKIMLGKDKKESTVPRHVNQNLPPDLQEEYRQRLHKFMFPSSSGMPELKSEDEHCQPQPLSCSDSDRQLLHSMHTMHLYSNRRSLTNQLRAFRPNFI